MSEYILFWASKYILDLIICGAIFIVAAMCLVPQWIKQARCKHDDGISETSACDAICQKCGKNLGFIGSVREKEGKAK